MDLIFEHQIKKKIKKDGEGFGVSDLKVYFDSVTITLIGDYFFNYSNPLRPNIGHYISVVSINTLTGDFIINKSMRFSLEERKYKTTKNNFKLLHDVSDYSLRRGEGRIRFWGTQYENAYDKAMEKILNILTPNFNSEYYLNQTINGDLRVNFLYDMILNFHLDKKNIKGHDSIHITIQDSYPKKKWLKKNDNKYVPAVLDSMGIKTKFYVTEVSRNQSPLILSTLNYLCKLFGDNHVSYMRNIPWQRHCVTTFLPNKRTHTLKNDTEKKYLVNIIKNWEFYDEIVNKLNSIFSLRERIEARGIKTKFKANDLEELLTLEVKWRMIEKYLKRGYKEKYTIPNKFKKIIEKPITISGATYQSKLLLTEDDFYIEGIKMKNCMGNQFVNGMMSLFVSMTSNFGKTININFKKNGEVLASYAKTNTDIPEDFRKPITILSEKIKSFENIEWKKEKYGDIL